jgi:hypothetical protein
MPLRSKLTIPLGLRYHPRIARGVSHRSYITSTSTLLCKEIYVRPAQNGSFALAWLNRRKESGTRVSVKLDALDVDIAVMRWAP